MSRSYRKPYSVLSNQIDKDQAHRQVRRRVKVELEKPEPDIGIIEMDTREFDLEEWGTCLGVEVADEYTSEEDIKKASRK